MASSTALASLNAGSICVAALYRFSPLPSCERLRDALEIDCQTTGIKGTLLLAEEGINGTIAGSVDAIDGLLARIDALPGRARLSVKRAYTDKVPFYRLKVRIKREIVTMGQPMINPLRDVGHYVSPQDWNALIRDPDTVVIDTRNAYEVQIGSFANAIDPGTACFRDFPDWFRNQRTALLDNRREPKIAMFCTGGIRCEKATAFLRSEGLEAVYHLDGGILRYLETVPQADSLWHGECFVFDQRVAVGHGLAPGTHSLCHGCRRPVSAEDRTSPLFREGISCPSCHDERGADRQARYAERHRQVGLAQQRGADHIGVAATPPAQRTAPQTRAASLPEPFRLPKSIRQS